MPTIRIDNLITLGRIIPRMRARDALEVVHALAARVSADTGVDKRDILSGLVSGGDLVVGPATGVALLHAFAPGIPQPVAAFAALHTPLDFNAADGRKSDLIVLLVSPDSRCERHLPSLALLSRRLRDRAVRDRLRAAAGREAIFAILAELDGSHQEHGNGRQRIG